PTCVNQLPVAAVTKRRKPQENRQPARIHSRSHLENLTAPRKKSSRRTTCAKIGPFMAHTVTKTPIHKRAVPFGITARKPRHFRDMLKVVWENRDNLGYAYKVLSRGVCDGCALGVAGFHDWTISGVHLCMTRLNLLRLNTMPELDGRLLEDVTKLESLDNARLRDLGRLPYPMQRRRG